MPTRESIRANLPIYFDIQENRRHARFQVAKAVAIELDESMDLDELWNVHTKKMEEFRRRDLAEVPDQKEGNLVELKRAMADKLLEECILCERRCRVDRKDGKTGVCGVKGARLSSEFLHFGEEPELIPSHTFFFAGCTFKCVFCQNWDISQDPFAGAIVEPKDVARTIEERCGRNVNWVGGDPTSNLRFVLEVMALCELNIPMVWNSNMFASEETMRILDGVIDVYLTDFKYGNNECGERLSKVEGYFDVVSRNHIETNRQCEMIIRHLVLPNHFECCTRPVLDWIAKALDNSRVRVNIMEQYRPEYQVLKRPKDYPDIIRRLSNNEWLKAYRYGERLGLNLV
jgi:putative pyruvate formate lyase activating enzyme